MSKNETKPLIIGVAGGSGAGKTTIANALAGSLNGCVILSQDDYYKNLDLKGINPEEYDFDNPKIRDSETLVQNLGLFLQNKEFLRPSYDFSLHKRKEELIKVMPAKFLIIEGTHVLFDDNLRELLSFGVFVDAEDEIRFSRRYYRDLHERSRSHESIINQYENSVRKGYENYVLPSRKHADLVVSGALGENEKPEIALARIVKQIIQKLREKFTI